MELLVTARKRAKLTQEQLAERLGRVQSFVGKYEVGERRIDLVEFMEIARVLQFDWTTAVKELEAEYGPLPSLAPPPKAELEPEPEPEPGPGPGPGPGPEPGSGKESG
jgi:transcriptional regulator with XRE-family HTH domain